MMKKSAVFFEWKAGKEVEKVNCAFYDIFRIIIRKSKENKVNARKEGSKCP